MSDDGPEASPPDPFATDKAAGEDAPLREALAELLAAEAELMPASEHGIDAQNAWADRRATARNNARFVLARPSPPTAPAAGMTDVDTLAQIIRKVDGNHSLGAGALAEAIVSELLAARLGGGK